MLSKVSSHFIKRSPAFKQSAVRAMMQTPQRSVSLLINDQSLTEEQALIQKTAYDFAKAELAPHAAEWDEKKHFPMDVYRRAAELGFAGIYTSEEHGGCGLGRIEASLIFEGLATGKIVGIVVIIF